MSTITFIIPCFNESETLPEMYKRLSSLTDKFTNFQFEFLFINDGSSDSTEEILKNFAKSDKRVRCLHFAKNHGHQIALSAGIDFANGDLIVAIDADLQDPPELLKEMIDKVYEGYDVIHAQRRNRSGETWFKLFTAKLFYWFIKRFSTQELIENCGDFRAFTRPVLEVARRFRERHKFLRGNFVLYGFRQCVIQYDRDSRFAGTTKYPFKKMVRFATDAVINFSTLPIRIVIFISFLLLMLSFVYLIRSLILHFVFHVTIPGWTSLIVLITLFASLQLFCFAIIGAYVGRIYEQVQNRPLYWIKDVQNISLDDASAISPCIQEIIISRNIVNSKCNIVNEESTK
ncbi:MAG: glycosyltransferase family 2 protein [Desulfobacterales bacterium]|nr:glycosyltransferase family 2 protein [Desulfobacterales bacterium]